MKEILIPILFVFFHLVATRVIMRQMSQDALKTRYGKVRGVLVQFPTRHLRSVTAYFGMRYASILGGSLRFMPPTNPMEKWNGVRVMVQNRNVCPQRVLNNETLKRVEPTLWREHLRRISSFVEKQTEDCLSLNIYVPQTQWNETQTRLAVMIFVHGEDFATGTGNAYDGSVLASYGQVIVVTLNYRLGVLGFLNTGQEGTTGNYGLLDLAAAIHWVRDNIASFNGDPERITVFGHGHGAALVNLMLITPFVNDGMLFRRAILQSGTALGTWSYAIKPVECTSSCNVKSPSIAPKYYACFGPSVNPKDSVLPRAASSLVKHPISTFNKIDIMMGLVKNEAFRMFSNKDINKDMTKKRRKQIIRTYVQNVFHYQRKEIYNLLDHDYTEWERMSGDTTNRDGVMDLVTDGQYVAPMVKLANAHTGPGKTYFYHFDYTSDLKSYGYVTPNGPVHGDELPFVFGAPIVDGVSPFTEKYSKTDKMLSEAVMRYWSNFAKTGNPNKPVKQMSVYGGRVTNRFVSLSWPRYDNIGQKYLRFSKRPIAESHYRAKKVALWLDLIPKLQDKTSKPEEHQLDNYLDKSTFDSPERLLGAAMSWFPPPPPSPPTPPSQRMRAYSGSTWPYFHKIPYNATYNDSRDARYQGITTNPVYKRDPKTHATDMYAVHDIQNFIPMSITISVGVALLFLNILIFAGIYYQRERIRKIKLSAENDCNEDVKVKRKIESQSVPGPEYVGLLAQHNSQAQFNNYDDGSTHSDKYSVPVKGPQVPNNQYVYQSPQNQNYSMQRYPGTLPRDSAVYSRSDCDRSRTLDNRSNMLQNSTTAV